MTWLIRKIDDPALSTNLASLDDIDSAAADPPLWAIRPFVPSAQDGFNLSVYQVQNNREIEHVAAAFHINFGEFTKTKISFVSALVDEVISAGFDIQQNLGRLNHRIADGLHREIPVTDIFRARTLAGLFMKGDPFDFEGRKVGEHVRVDARLGAFNFALMAKNGAQSKCNINMIRFIAEGLIIAKGNDERN